MMRRPLILSFLTGMMWSLLLTQGRLLRAMKAAS
jgi:hypothetical protein